MIITVSNTITITITNSEDHEAFLTSVTYWRSFFLQNLDGFCFFRGPAEKLIIAVIKGELLKRRRTTFTQQSIIIQLLTPQQFLNGEI